MLRDSEVVTKLTRQEKALLKILCVKRTIKTGEKTTVRSLVYSLIKNELEKAIANKEIDPKEVQAVV